MCFSGSARWRARPINPPTKIATATAAAKLYQIHGCPFSRLTIRRVARLLHQTTFFKTRSANAFTLGSIPARHDRPPGAAPVGRGFRLQKRRCLLHLRDVVGRAYLLVLLVGGLAADKGAAASRGVGDGGGGASPPARPDSAVLLIYPGGRNGIEGGWVPRPNFPVEGAGGSSCPRPRVGRPGTEKGPPVAGQAAEFRPRLADERAQAKAWSSIFS